MTGKYTVSGHMRALFQPGNFTRWGSEGVKREKKVMLYSV